MEITCNGVLKNSEPQIVRDQLSSTFRCQEQLHTWSAGREVFLRVKGKEGSDPSATHSPSVNCQWGPQTPGPRLTEKCSLLG